MFVRQVDRRINLTAHIAHAYGDPDPRFMTITRVQPGSVRFSWTNNSLPTDGCPRRQIDELSSRLISPDTGDINPDFRDAMRPYQLLGASATPLGVCTPPPPPSDATTAVSSTTARDEGPVVSGLVGDDSLMLVMIVAACVIAVLLVVLIIIICVCCCRQRRRRRSEKQRRAADDELSCANKGIPVIFADELLDYVDDDDDKDEDTPASTLKRRGRGAPEDEDGVSPGSQPPPPDYPRSDPASRTSTLRSDYKAALISSDDDDDDDEHRQLVNNGDTLPVYNGNDNKLS